MLGLTEGVIGPTLLDLKDLVGMTLGQICTVLYCTVLYCTVGGGDAGPDQLPPHDELPRLHARLLPHRPPP